MWLGIGEGCQQLGQTQHLGLPNPYQALDLVLDDPACIAGNHSQKLLLAIVRVAAVSEGESMCVRYSVKCGNRIPFVIILKSM